MTQRTFSLVTAMLFLLIALLHAVRLSGVGRSQLKARSCPCKSSDRARHNRVPCLAGLRLARTGNTREGVSPPTSAPQKTLTDSS